MVSKEILVWGAAVVEISGALYYLYSIPRGTTRPQPVTWLGWTVIGALGAWTSRHEGAGLAGWINWLFVLVTLSVFVTSMLPGYGHNGRSNTEDRNPTDTVVLLCGVILIALWAIGVLSPALSITAAIAGDSCFAYFTWQKARRFPDTENLTAWLMAVPVAAVGVYVLGKHSFTAAAFSYYVLFGNSLIAATLLLKKFSSEDENVKKKG